jgi:hypothetical protein
VKRFLPALTSRAHLAWLVVNLAGFGCARGAEPDGGDARADGAADGAADATADVPIVDVPPPMDVFACTGSTCTVPNGTGSCVAGVCQVGMCVSGAYDIDHDARNGCECVVGVIASTCAMATDLGTLPAGSFHLVESLLPAGMTEHWVKATLPSGGRAHVEFLSNPGMAYRFDVAPSCMAGAQLSCPDHMAGSTGITSWEFFDTVPDAGTTHTDDPSRMVALPPTTVYIRVTAMHPSTGCQPYQLLVGNDVW